MNQNNPPPLITHVYTADPSAHVFPSPNSESKTKRLYIYPSHDIPNPTPASDLGAQYAMNDYHVFSLPTLSTLPGPVPVTDHGVVLSLADIPWAKEQLWAPDAVRRGGKYYLVFPAKDKQGVFRIGVASGEKPEGPFVPEETWLGGEGVGGIDPAVFVDSTPGDGEEEEEEEEEGEAYVYFGGVWGGQLQCWRKKDSDSDSEEGGWIFDEAILKSGIGEPSGAGTRALFPRVAKLSKDMKTLLTPVLELQILSPEPGNPPIRADDHTRRFFEASWMHKRNSTYYFSYSTGDTHYIVYATGTSPLGPFTYRGRILEPVVGWTTHHSIVEFEGRWWIFYHDCEISEGVSHLRNVKVREIGYDEEGGIFLVD
ncbi:glycosyl hydrolase [Aspergillus cavernicola]|uniref:Glycosyl hydrolase n=1 Tax=Aspergillus cavernicola TaxID=176166 RepID=A0ABR4IVP2_9EURO